MLNILIITTPDDSHAINIMLALKQKKCNPVLWYMADFPNQQTHSFEFKEDEIHWTSVGPHFQIDNDHFDVVWYRRPKKPTNSLHINKKDKRNSQLENAMLYHSFWEVIAQDAVWINPVKNANAANSKLLQLKVAKQCDLKTPATLVSNDPNKIRKFITDYNPMNVVYKTMHPLHWIENDKLHLAYTHKVTLGDLPTDEILQSTAGIFQECVKKAYEVRVTYFGEQAVAVKIDSQVHVLGRMDWRAVPTNELSISEHTLSSEVDMKCRNMLKKMGLVFGCFDFIVTPDEKYVFLEINESGQFLWVEDLNPNIKMLHLFSDFLLNRGKISSLQDDNVISLGDFKELAQLFFKKVIQLHQNTHILN